MVEKEQQHGQSAAQTPPAKPPPQASQRQGTGLRVSVGLRGAGVVGGGGGGRAADVVMERRHGARRASYEVIILLWLSAGG